jgi:hypothetical protein
VGSQRFNGLWVAVCKSYGKIAINLSVTILH